MLIEYTESTKEENLAASAIEIRKRVAGRKLIKAVEDGVINQDTVSAIHDANRKEHNQHTHVSFGITMVGVSSRVAVARAEQQLSIENKLKLLDRDVARASSLSKSKVDTLSDLERRILDMKAQLRVYHAPSVSEEIRKDLISDNTVWISKNFMECTKCKRKILVNMLDAHEKQCKPATVSLTRELLLVEHKSEKQATIFETATFPPGVPRYCKLVSKGCDYIEWGYEPPVTDGGLLVTDYEIRYEGKYQEMDAKTNKWRKESIHVPSLMTSRWALSKPINDHLFRIHNLRSETDYFNFYIRCMNMRGCSDWVPMNEGEIVRTNDTEPPSVPLFFACSKVTSSCLHLNWAPPWFSGGQEIVDYIVHYTVIEREISVTSREVMVEKDKSYALGQPDTSVVIRNIMSDSDVVKITLQCKNKAGLLSEKLKLGHNCRTAKCSRHMELQKQLHIASFITEPYIDTDFFSGVQQRVPIEDFISDVKKYLLITEPTEEEAEEAITWGLILEKKEAARKLQAELDDMAERIKRGELTETTDALDEESSSEDSEDETVIAKKKEVALKKSFLFTNAQRRRHYEKKMRKVEQMIEQLTKEKHELDMNRARLAMHMQTTQTRQMLLKVERDRLSNYNSEYVSSSVIHGYEVQYLLEDFLDTVAVEYAKCQTEISSTKLKVMNGEKRKAEIKRLLANLQDLWKERKAAFLQFEMRCRSTFKSLARLQGMSGVAESGLQPHYFGLWTRYVEDRKSTRRKVTQTFLGVLRRFKSSAFIKWKTGQFELDSKDSSMFLGVGSKLLQEAREQRVQLQGELREAIAGAHNIRQTLETAALTRENRRLLINSTVFKSQEEGQDHVKLAESGLSYLYEADGYVSQGKYELALRMYDTQIIMLRAVQPVNIKQLSLVHGRQGRMFLLMDRFDRAVLEFDRQLSLAREIQDKGEEADAYFGIGVGYMKRFVYEEAVRYLDLAQGLFASLGLASKRASALRVLRDCFDRIGKDDSVRMYEERIEMIEGDTRTKLRLIHKKLGLMQERLVHSAADIELVVQMERTTLKSLQLRNKIADMTSKQKEYQKQKKVYEDVMAGIGRTLNAIQAELKEAFETDELEMWSKLVQDTPQLVDVEELKTRLAARRTAELSNYDREKSEFDRLAKLIGNLEDDLEEADDNLKLEEGALMTRSRHDKPFRCISFCAANAAGNEVTGTATGGVENFVAAEGSNIHLLDHHNGSLLTVLVGDSKTRVGTKQGHVGVVTCLVHDASLVFSGSVDETIMSWDAVTYARKNIFQGHEGSIVAMAVDGPHLASGSADTTIRLWDKVTAVQLRVVFGHSKSVTSLELGPTWLLTGSADEEVRVWELQKKHKHTLSVDCRSRLVGHEAAVTCVRYGRLEVVSGDVLGRLFLWWTESGAILRVIQAHTGSIKCLQFDAIHIVSGGVDMCVCITDIATGEVLQSLRGHTGHVLAISFDSERILSAAGDNTMRFWSWGKKTLPEDKIHVLNQGETLVAVAKLYDLSVSELATWNGITDVRKQMYPGMNLIVRKGDPSAPTAAERVAAERARRIQQAKLQVTSKFKAEGMLGTALSYDRIQRLATDFDTYSLGNRMFSAQKQENELFPDSVDPNVDTKSLGSRLKRKDAREAALEEDQPAVLLLEGNEDVWGSVADQLGTIMLETLVELEAYELVLALMSVNRDVKAVVGRVHRYELENASRFAEESHSEALQAKLVVRHAEAEERKREREALLKDIEEREQLEQQQEQQQKQLLLLQGQELGQGQGQGQETLAGQLDDSRPVLALLNDSLNFELAAAGLQGRMGASVIGKDIDVELAAATAAEDSAGVGFSGNVSGNDEGMNTNIKHKKHKRTLSAEKRATKNRIRKWHYSAAAHDTAAPTAAVDHDVSADLDQSLGIIQDNSPLDGTALELPEFLDSSEDEAQNFHSNHPPVATTATAGTAENELEAPGIRKKGGSPASIKRRNDRQQRALSAERRAAKNNARKNHSLQVHRSMAAVAAAGGGGDTLTTAAAAAAGDHTANISASGAADDQSLPSIVLSEPTKPSDESGKSNDFVRFPPIKLK